MRMIKPSQQKSQQQSQQQSQNTNENLSEEQVGFSEIEEPKKRGRKPGSAAAQNTEKKLRDGLTALFGTACGLMAAMPNEKIQTDALIVHRGSEPLITAIIELSKQDKYVRSFLLTLLTSSAYANVMIASMPIVIGILANHGLIPPLFQKAEKNGVYAN